ncbi:MAG TPA: glycosyltransferase family 39 protein, partial [Kofleriaceae bacterium]
MTRWRAAAALALIAWCVVVVALRRPGRITDDWMGWRQADTQAIARNLVEEGFTPLHPRIDWRGDGPGFVETELQLYPTLIAATMEVAGEAEWPGQLLSLACTVAALALLAAALARRYGEPAGFVALLALLGHQGTLAIATSIQPDSLALLLFVIGWLAFVADLEAPSRRTLALWIAATALAGLVKPTT